MNHVGSPRLSVLLGASAIACLAVVGLAVFHPKAALTGWLAAFALVGSLPIGTLFLALLLRLVPGKWREDLMPLSENLLFTVALLLPAVLPVLVGASHIYSWAGTTAISGFQAFYLSGSFFALRSIVLLLAALLLAVLLHRAPGVKAVAVIGIIAFVLLHSLLATDWVMSLDPKFHSSGFGLYFLCIQVLTALSLLIAGRVLTATPSHPDILGGLLLTGILLWSYFSFLQYLIIWSDNLPDGAAWYLQRGSGPWHVAEITMTSLRLGPGILLLFSNIRRSPLWLAILSLTVVLGSFIEMAWLVLPSLTGDLNLGLMAYLLSLAGLSLLLTSTLRLSRRLGERINAAMQNRRVLE